MAIFFYDTAIGKLAIVVREEALTHIFFEGKPTPAAEEIAETELHRKTVQQLNEYFAGERTAFELPLAPQGTVFQQSVWQALLRIPYGQTTSYKRIAEDIGNPKAVRAVGLANGANPIPLIIPCHRVIGSNGSLTGFGGGLALKEKLLTLESEQLTL